MQILVSTLREWIRDTLALPDGQVIEVPRDVASVPNPPPKPYVQLDVLSGPRLIGTVGIFNLVDKTVYRQPGEWSLSLRFFGAEAPELATCLMLLASTAPLPFTVEPFTAPINTSQPTQNGFETMSTLDLTVSCYIVLEKPPVPGATAFVVTGLVANANSSQTLNLNVEVQA